MGYLSNLADVCRTTGYPVIEVGGGPGQTGNQWVSRGRSGSGGDSTGGYQSGKPTHVMVHHTASGTGSDGWGDVNYCTFSHQDAPICNLYLSRKGEIFVCAGGATNTNGSGHDPCGVASDDNMNSQAIGIEAGNAGTGEQWPEVMQDAYLALVKALCDAYLGSNYGRCHAHFEWAPSRKIDPAGNSRYASGGASWDMNHFRNDVPTGGSGTTPPPQPEPEPPQPQPPSGGEYDWMASLPTIKKGDSGPYVERMQHLLAAAGYMNPANTANYDGVWGNGTDGAKKSFDSAHGLGGSDTSCGPKSWESLMTGKTW